MIDKIEKIRNSLIQHGKGSNRIYLMKLDPEDVPEILLYLDELSVKECYSKVFAKIPEDLEELFVQKGYVRESFIPRFFNGTKACVFLSKFWTDERKQMTSQTDIREIIALAQSKGQIPNLTELRSGYSIDAANPVDAREMSEVYKRVFVSYPFAIHDPKYIQQTMASHIQYYVVRHSGRIAAVSSSEMDRKARNVEMTDFAALPEHRGQHLASHLLRHMEKAMLGERMITLYTIARSLSHGMNITFAENGYVFSGTLVNNTCISGQIESMNVWYKHLE